MISWHLSRFGIRIKELYVPKIGICAPIFGSMEYLPSGGNLAVTWSLELAPEAASHKVINHQLFVYVLPSFSSLEA